MDQQDVIRQLVSRYLRKNSYSRRLVERVRYNIKTKPNKNLGTNVFDSVYELEEFKILVRSLRNTRYDCRKSPENIFTFLDNIIKMKKDEIRTSKD
jgi:hypothetical protein